MVTRLMLQVIHDAPAQLQSLTHKSGLSPRAEKVQQTLTTEE